MPFLNISTNKKIKNEQDLLAKSSYFISSTLNKPEKFLMVKLNDSSHMNFVCGLAFCGSPEQCTFFLNTFDGVYISMALHGQVVLR